MNAKEATITLRRIYERNMKATTKAMMKATHEMLITVCKYAFYQDPKNYEGNKEGEDEG